MYTCGVLSFISASSSRITFCLHRVCSSDFSATPLVIKVLVLSKSVFILPFILGKVFRFSQKL